MPKRATVNHILKVGDRIQHKRTRVKGTVTTVNPYYGWYEVTYDDNSKRSYNYSVRASDRMIMPIPDPKKKKIINNQE